MVRNNMERSRAEREAYDWIARLQLRDPSAQAEFAVWYAADPANAAAFDAVRETDAKSDVAAASDLVRLAQLRRGSFIERKPGTSCALAASLAVLAMLGTGLGLREAGYFAPSASPSETLALTTRAGEVRTITLTDGSRVTLGGGTVLRVAFTGDTRRLRLDSGRARFEVAHDPRRPFVVGAGDGEVVAHGTVFDVSVGPAGVRVVLLRGAIEVSKRGRPDQLPSKGSSRRLTPGQQVTFDRSHPISEPVPAGPAELRWTAGMLSFDNARLGDAVAEFNRHSAHKIALASPDIAELRISGGFRAGQIDKFAEVIAATFGLRLTSEPDRILLSHGERQGAS